MENKKKSKDRDHSDLTLERSNKLLTITEVGRSSRNIIIKDRLNGMLYDGGRGSIINHIVSEGRKMDGLMVASVTGQPHCDRAP